MTKESLLIKQSLAGDSKSFSKLVVNHQIKLRQYLLSRCQNSHDADDVLQETFISAYKYLHSYNSKWQFNTWLFTIANRLIAKQKKFSHSFNEVHENDVTVELEELAIDKNNIWLQIKKIVTEESYDVLWFFYVEELATKEIAKILNKSNSWVKISLYRNKKKLAQNKNIQVLSKEYLMLGIIL